MIQAVRRGLLLRRNGFNPRTVCMWFVVEKVALGQISLRVLRFSPVSIVMIMLHFHSFIHTSPTLYNLSNWQCRQMTHVQKSVQHIFHSSPIWSPALRSKFSWYFGNSVANVFNEPDLLWPRYSTLKVGTVNKQVSYMRRRGEQQLESNSKLLAYRQFVIALRNWNSRNGCSFPKPDLSSIFTQ